ncbi:AAA family ATPase [Nocardioides sp. NPDC004968]|uniref:AAA family ATPase n=1 Tax=Nocardioides sp. NPDC004968 TaxID=3155894 RepID=UPI0033BAD803
MSAIRFRVVGSVAEGGSSTDTVYLVRASWDDWFSFQTLFNAYYVDIDGERHRIGGTKIGQRGLKAARDTESPRSGYRVPEPSSRFSELTSDFFSLGQDPSYYEALTKIGNSFREEYLRRVRDLAFDPEWLDAVKDEPVTRISLLREIPISTIRDQFARLARGGARLTRFDLHFEYVHPESKAEPVNVTFAVDPASKLPSNIHVIIGRNGVGKSSFLNSFAEAMIRDSVEMQRIEPGVTRVANLVQVSFSAFDAFDPLVVPKNRSDEFKYHFVGLRKTTGKDEAPTPKTAAGLSAEMTRSAKVCLIGARRQRLLRALQLLEGDPLFAEAELPALFEDATEDGDGLEELPRKFRRLSSGHKIVLLTVTRLVETVEEKSLVLLDEPEAHLHPPLLSAFVRALSDLLTNRNGIGIIATHSPVVLQEVPRTCAWKLQRYGFAMRADRPQIETFGENVGTLTDEIFGLEVTATGFHRMLSEAASTGRPYEQIVSDLDGQLGTEGRAILRSMTRALSEPRDVAD